MKKTRKLLSVVLATLVAVASMPMVYTQSFATGTADNPTTALVESNPFEYEDLYKLNIKHSNNDFFFYQTIDDEYFALTQNLYLQQYTVSLGSNRDLLFGGLNFYEGESSLASATDSSGVYEQPEITTNETSSFLANHYVSDTWISTNSNSSGLDCTGAVDLDASGWDLNGSHKQYTWDHTVVFKGNSADVTGQINTSFYERALWTWSSDSSSASMDFRIKTTITVVDAREFVEQLAIANDVIANPSEHSAGYVSALQAVLNTIPDSAENLSAQYDQATIDSYAEALKSVKQNSADYTEYNYVYGQVSAMTNANNTYSDQSFTEFQTAVANINANLPKDLTIDDQETVDAAVQAIKDAFNNILVFNGVLTEGVTHSETLVDMSVTVGTEFNLIQVKDDQKFSLAQPWTISHSSSQARKFAVVLDTSDTDTNTFISMLDSSSYTTQDFDNKALSQSGVTTFSCWDELDSDGNFKDASDFLNSETRTINPDYDGFKSGNTYYLQSTPIFYGAGAEVTGEQHYYYDQIFYAGWVNVFGFGGDSANGTFTTTINITDARPLVDAYEQAGIIISEEDSPYTDAFVAELEAAYNAVPQAMVNGLAYYSQADVDSVTATLTTLLNNKKVKADYTAYDEAVAEAEAIIADGNSAGAYEQSAFDAYVSAVAGVPVPDRTLSTDDQATVDASTNQLLELKQTLENNRYADYTELDAAKEAAQAILNNPSAYSQETLDTVAEALAAANEVPANMVVGEGNVNQTTIDNAAATLNGVLASVVALDADYSAYNEALAEINAIISAGNVDADGNAIYDEEIFTNVGTYVESLDSSLDKNLKADNQATIDEATETLIAVTDYLKANEYIDYTEFNAAKAEIENIVNNPTNYTEETVVAAKTVLEKVNTISTDYVYVGEDNVNQNRLDEAVAAMQEVIINAQTKADYTDFNTVVDALEEIVNAPEGTYTDETVQNAQNALDNIVAGTDMDLPSSEQATLDEITSSLQDVVNSAKEKADYSGLDEAYQAAQEIVNAPEGTYTDESVQNAQAAIDAADALNKDLEKNEENQTTINGVIADLTDAVANAQTKADYTDFNTVVDALEEIVNAPEGTYTDETVQNAQNALDNVVAGTDMDLPSSEQATLDEITSSLQDVVNSAEEKADYTDYNNAKAEADSLVNDDGNGNPIYDEDAFNAYKDAINNIDSSLYKDLPLSEQATVDGATSDLADLKATLEEKKLYTITFIGLDGETLATQSYTNGSLFGTIIAPELPVETELNKYVGWLNAEGILLTSESVLNGDVVLTIAEDVKKILPVESSEIVINEETGYVTGIDKDTTVEELKALLENDETVVEIKNFEGNLLASENLVGTGSTITIKSKYTDVVYETKTVIIYGDVDGDGDVDTDDRNTTNGVAVGNGAFDEAQGFFFVAADVCNDGYINALDAWVINLISAGLRTVTSVA